MGIEENKQTVLRFIEALNTQGYATFNDPAFVTEDFTWWILGRGTFTGPQMIEAVRRAQAQYAGPGQRTVTGITAEGDRVAVEYAGDTPLKRGGTYANFYHNLFVLRDGRIAQGKEYLDTAYAQATLRGGDSQT